MTSPLLRLRLMTERSVKIFMKFSRTLQPSPTMRVQNARAPQFYAPKAFPELAPARRIRLAVLCCAITRMNEI